MGGRVRRHTAVRRSALALAGTLVISGVVACGGDDAQAEAQRIVLGAAQATFSQGTAQVLVTLEGLGDDDGTGQVDFENLLSEVEVDLDGETTTVIVDGEDTFVGRNGTYTQDLDGLPDVATIVLFLQPLQALQILNGADGDIDIVGDDDVDGVPATHYQVTVDLQAALDALDGADRAALQAAIDRLGTDSLVVDVWIDDDGVVRRMTTDIDLGDGQTVTVTLDFEDFGSPVRIRTPRPRAVVSAEDFELASADIAGSWTAQIQVVSATVPGWVEVGQPGPEAAFDVDCRPNGSCVDSENGSRLEPAGPGTWTNTSEETGPCGATPGGYHQTSEFTWTVTAYEDGVATEMTLSGTINGEVLPAGIAGGCRLGQGLVGPTTGTATVEGTATRA